jgi:two-component system, OmpR family, sensor histidine kinase MprB
MAGLHYRASLASRVTLLATVAVGLFVAVVAGAGYLTVRHTLYNNLDSSLSRRAWDMRKINVNASNVETLPPWVLAATDAQIGILFSDGTAQSAPSQDIADAEKVRLGDPELKVAGGASSYSCRTIVTASGHQYRVAAVPGVDKDSALILAQSLTPTDSALDRLGLILLLFGGLGVVAAGAAGWGVARNGLRPVRRLTAKVEEIARTEKLDPIEVEGNDEVARLSLAFNQMLTSLGASRDRQRQLVADAGHELRTPLTSLRTNLDLLTQAEKRGGLSEAAKTELLDDVRFQIEELTTLIGDLTELARDEPVSAAVEAVDFDEVVERAVDRVRRRASNLHFDVHLDQWWVVGEAGSVERAITNLLDNAAKWSPAGGTVTVVLQDGTLTVTDQGRGIAEEDLPHVFDRFYRSKESRTMPGSGLGLAIVRQIAERHGGVVWVSRTGPSGTSFTLHLPGSAMQPEGLSRFTGSA